MGAVLALVTSCSGSSSPANNAGAQASNSPGASPSASASSVPSTGATTSPGATPGAKTTPATGHTVSSGPGSTAPGRPTGFTRAGTYHYDYTGSSTTQLRTQPFEGTDAFKVDAPVGDTQKSTQQGQQGSRDTTLASRSGGLYVVDINIQQSSFKEDFKPVGTALFFPANYHVGSAWHWAARSTDGKYHMAVSSKITSSTTITIHGQKIPTLVVDSVVRFTGNGFDLTENQRDWVSTAYALVVKEHTTEHGTIAGFKYSAEQTRTIRSTTPTSS